MDFNLWFNHLQNVLQEEKTPLQINNGHWQVSNREELWKVLGSRVFDKNLDCFKECAITVLKELDPRFELPPEERYMASIHGKVPRYSSDLKKGLAEALAIMANQCSFAKHCSQRKAEIIAILTVREILKNADWKLWASLNNLLPILAEAAPDEFISSVENALKQTLSPFDEIFAQEGAGVFGGNYLTGLLWALETLAWDEKYLTRIAIILAELHTHDPGGNWSNRPGNSLKTILLPWHPSTLASFKKHIAAVRAVQADFPAVAWDLLLGLLPNPHQVSFGSHKPKWRNIIPDDWKPQITEKEYFERVTAYSELAVELACDEPQRLGELVEHIDNLPKTSFDAVLQKLSSDTVLNASEETRQGIWEHLCAFVTKHRSFSDADWALEPKLIEQIEEVASKIAPTKLQHLYARLFIEQDFELYEEQGDWEKQQKILEDKRINAIQKILDRDGIQGVLNFVNSVKSPRHVGWALGKFADSSIDNELLPSYLCNNEEKRDFIYNYVLSKYYKKGSEWIDSLDTNKWSDEQRIAFLVFLPFQDETWKYAGEWPGSLLKKYWKKALVNPYNSGIDLLLAVNHLLDVKRPNAAIDCLYALLYKSKVIDKELTVQALLAATVTNEPKNTMDHYHIEELIKTIQIDPAIDENDMSQIEWAYLPLLRGDRHARPEFLEKRLASNPDFFCEIIQLIYRSDKEDKRDVKPNKKQEALATNAWKLLKEWKRIPGLQDDKTFSERLLQEWLKAVMKQCDKTGHLDIALLKIGEVLFYSPPDPEGLWILQPVAKILNGRNADRIRDGYATEAFNSIGVRWIDPTGEPERERAKQWREKADAVEALGYARFSATLRNLAEDQDREADRIITEHKEEKNES
jgi:hypothetical protein